MLSGSPHHPLLHGPTPQQQSSPKTYVKNAFNSLRRDIVLQEAQNHLPEIYPFVWDCYSSKTSLFHGNFSLDSATGVQQGNSLSPALFALAINADLNIWYLDDGCIGGDPQTVLTNATMIKDIILSVSYSLSITQTSTSPKQASSFKTNSHPSSYLTVLIGSY